MKQLNQFIVEYIIKKKLDKPIDSENNYKYSPINKEQLINNINECIDLGEYNLNVIDVSSIKDMSKLFRSVNLDKIKRGSKLDISKWDVSNVEFMNYMFQYCENFNGDLSKWNVSKVENMKGMFKKCESFEGKGLENWDINNVKSMNYMFDGCTSLKNKPSWYKE